MKPAYEITWCKDGKHEDVTECKNRNVMIRQMLTNVVFVN